jgi:hypothetical protein
LPSGALAHGFDFHFLFPNGSGFLASSNIGTGFSVASVTRALGGIIFFGCDTPEIAHHICTGKFDAVLEFGWYVGNTRNMHFFDFDRGLLRGEIFE